MTLLGFKTILHKKCRSGKNSEGPAENFSKMKTNFKKSDIREIIIQMLVLMFIFFQKNKNLY
jgi:hypothetical protein